ncbi:hypothetical protein B9Z19DRAFT_1126041 [Tuber borchii]|uniref:ATP-grasp domain-containing protein n=1 Tax=Tuber borchii TaxID=42251 RepID=A0A2T6ZTI6_TUBBO|nr:hypothetical protein B9Z19DRAFT_1126041 [Tuber borchii]
MISTITSGRILHPRTLSFSSRSPRRYKTSLAIHHQAIPPPIINGSFKPPKPGGCKDACADIAYTVHSLNDPKINITTPAPHPNPATDTGWSFPDTQPGILTATAAANPPKLVEVVDNKAFTNKLLQHHGFPTPKSWLLEGDPKRSIERLGQLVYDLPYPIILKPVRGRGSEGVQLVNGFVGMLDALDDLLNIYSVVLVEELLKGEEGTRFSQASGAMPWSGHIPVTKSSRVLSAREEDSWHRGAKIECQMATELLKLTRVTRIDIRRKDENGGKFFLYDVNPRSNRTGASHPGRDDQHGLCTMATKGFG